MPYCPKCKSEYRIGISRCADCDVDLEKQRPPEGDLVLVFPAAQVDAVLEALKDKEIELSTTTLRPPEGDPVQVRFSAEDLDGAWRILRRLQDIEIPESAEPQWVTIFRGELSQAEALRAALEAAGIPAQEPDEDVFAVDPADRVRADVLVQESDREAAGKVMRGMDRIEEEKESAGSDT